MGNYLIADVANGRGKFTVMHVFRHYKRVLSQSFCCRVLRLQPCFVFTSDNNSDVLRGFITFTHKLIVQAFTGLFVAYLVNMQKHCRACFKCTCK